MMILIKFEKSDQQFQFFGMQAKLRQNPENASTPIKFMNKSFLSSTQINDSHIFSFNNSSFYPATSNEQNAKKNKLQINQFSLLETVLRKRLEERENQDHRIINKFVKMNPFFQELSSKISIDFSKNLVKYGKIQKFNERDKIFNEGKKVRFVNILMEGEVIVTKYTPKRKQDHDLWTTFDLLIEDLNKKSKKVRSKSVVEFKHVAKIIEELFFFNTLPNIEEYDIVQRINKQQILDFQCLYQYDAIHEKSIIASHSSKIFLVPIQKVHELLLQEYNNRIIKKMRFFQSISVFKLFENSRLRTLIQNLKVQEFSKGQYLYKQGQPAQFIYILLQGQIQISKYISLLAENPNNLYQNRKTIKKLSNVRNLHNLPYINLEGVYNYKSTKKLIHLSIINPISIFGEEQFIFKKVNRQVQAMIRSLRAKLYKINIKSVEEICSSNENEENSISLERFFQELQKQISLKKILLRQNQLSNLIEIQNKKTLQTIWDKPNDNKYSEIKTTKGSVANESSNSVQLNKNIQDQVPPTYHSLNYTDLMKIDEQILVCNQSLIEQEKLIVDKLHVQGPPQKREKRNLIRIKNKSNQKQAKKLSNQSKFLSHQKSKNGLSPAKWLDTYSVRGQQKIMINLTSPLINLSYFQHQEVEQKRLKAQSKKIKYENISKLSKKKSNLTLFQNIQNDFL